MYYYVLHVTNLGAMATMYMVNFVNKLGKKKKYIYSISHLYNILKTGILPNVLLIWLPWQCHGNYIQDYVYRENEENVSPSPIAIILMTESQI